MLTPPCPPRPPLLQTRSSDIDRSTARNSRRTAGRAADKEAREEKAASERARREAARLAVAGGTSASGAGGGGTEALGSAMNLEVDIAVVSAVASSLRSSHIPDVDDSRRAESASRIARKDAIAADRGALPANLDHNNRGRRRVRRPPNAPVGQSPVVHTGLSVKSSLPSSTPSSATLPRRVPQPIPLWVRHASFLPLPSLHRVLCWH